MSEPLKCYWWSHPCKAGVYNFGDLLTPMLLKYYKASHCIRPVSSPADADLLVVGSILQGVPEQNSPIILGAGSLTDKTLNIPKAKVYALRGLLTKERLGITDDVVVGDPGLLISRILPIAQLALDAKDEDIKPIGIVPHWKHYASPRLARYRSDPRFKFINPRCKPEQVAKEICSCSSIIASSLHALIVADAYGVPNVRLNFNDGLRDVCDFKYEDYYSAIARTGFAARSITPEEISTDLVFDTYYQKNVARVQDNLDNVFRRFYTEQCALQPSDDTKIRSISAPKVSVIVPVYKAKEYIGDLLESLLNQTLREMEFIFVDDKGGDGTFDIVREAAKRDNRIVCLENAENRGPGYSRNRGMDVARGEYIAFADADDCMSLDFYEVLYTDAILCKALVVKGGCCHVYDDGTIKERTLNKSILEKKASSATLLNAFTSEHWAAVYLREFVLRVGARNNETASYGEDTHFLMTLMYHLKYEDFFLENSVFYYYRRQPTSLTYCKKDSIYFEQMVRRCLARLEWIYAHPDTAELTEYTTNVFEGQLGWVLDDALRDDARDEDINGYLQFCLGKLNEWKTSGRVYKPGILASALVELKHCPYHFTSLRKVYLRLNKAEERCVSLLRVQNNLRHDIQKFNTQYAALKSSVESWQNVLEDRFCKQQDIVDSCLEKLCRFRMELHQAGGDENSFVVDGAEPLLVSTPTWLCRDGYGMMFQGYVGTYSLRVDVRRSGTLSLCLRGVNFRDLDGHVLVWVDVTNIRIASHEYEPRSVRHDKSYIINTQVVKGQKLEIQISVRPHLHTDAELVQLISALHPEFSWAQEHVAELCGVLHQRMAALRGISLPTLKSAIDETQHKLDSMAQELTQHQDVTKRVHESLLQSHCELVTKAGEMSQCISEQRSAIACLQKELTERSSRLVKTEQVLAKTEQELLATKKTLSEFMRVQQLMAVMPRLMARYRLLRVKKCFSFGKRRLRYKQKIAELKVIIREYRDAVACMRFDQPC